MKDNNLLAILNLIKSPKFLSTFPEITSAQIDLVETQFNFVSSESFAPIFNVEKVSDGLVNKNLRLSLAEEWGVELSKEKNPFISSPNNLRFMSGKFLVSNQVSLNSTTACCELDANLNFKGVVGKVGSNLSQGQYQDPVELTYCERNSSYYVVSKNDNIIHRYHNKTKQFIESIGNGDNGAEGEIDTKDSLLSKPVAITFGLNYIYVLCNSGEPNNSSGEGFVAVYDFNNNFKCIALYCGLNGGTGTCYEGEIKNPKDMFVTQYDGRDRLYILNGNDEIGIFDTNALNEGVGALTMIDVINLPSKLGLNNPGLERMTESNDILYLTSKNTGQVIALNIITGDLIGVFGKLADESSKGMDNTLGFLNGVSGIVIKDNKVYVSESLNNRIQVFGKSLFINNKFEVVFQPIRLPLNKEIKHVCYSLVGDSITDIKIIDLSDDVEIDIETAIKKKVNHFKVKLYIDPMKFSLQKESLKLEPLFLLMESFI